MSEINVYMKVARTKVLGPGLRYALWVQGCPFRCRGCMTPDSLPLDQGTPHLIHHLAQDVIADSELEGVTISGGEPFLQADALAQWIKEIRKQRDIGVIVYSGYTLATLKKMAERDARTDIYDFLEHIDLLIDGQYVESLNDGRSLRGSSNQVIHPLTDRYLGVLEQCYESTTRKVEVHLDQQDVKLVGVPGPAMLNTWKQQFAK